MSDMAMQPTWLNECAQKNPHFAGQVWLDHFRAQELHKFQLRGFPSRKEEAWKYTVVASIATQQKSVPQKITAAQLTELSGYVYACEKLTHHVLVFVNGYFEPDLSRTANLPQGVILCSLSEAFVQHEAFVKPWLTREYDEKRFPFAKLNAALSTDGVFLHLAQNINVREPIHLLFLNTEQNEFIINPRNLILAEKKAQVKIIEEHVSLRAENYLTNVVTEIQADANARVDYYKIQDDSFSAKHFANIFVHQQQESQVRSYVFSHGAQLAREDLTVFQPAKRAECMLHGYYHLQHENQHMDHHVYVDHQAEHGISKMLYKGILDKKSRAVFNGKVHVHPNAQHINAHQANHNLLLCADAEVNSKPELEIYADDVRCTHGATVGQLDTESLFYLQARGIAKQDALQILTRAFAEEIFAQIEHPDIRQYVKNRMRNHDEL